MRVARRMRGSLAVSDKSPMRRLQSVVLLLFLVSCEREWDPSDLGKGTDKFLFELQVPADWPLPDNTKVCLATAGSMGSIPLSELQRKVAYGKIIFSGDTLVHTDRRPPRRYLLLETPGQAAQVFRLDIPRVPEPAPWTSWESPIFALDAKESACWEVMNIAVDGKHPTGTLVAEAKLRYSVEPWPAGEPSN